MKKAAPSEAQAKRLAGLFADETKSVLVSKSYNTPTDVVLVKRGWIAPNGYEGEFPSGAKYEVYKITEAGMRALEQFLFERRCRTVPSDQRGRE